MRIPTEEKNQEPCRLRVLLADPSPEICRKLRAELGEVSFVDIVGEANTDDEALKLVFQLRPDVAIVSICLPEKGGFEVLRRIERTVPDCSVILLTSRNRDGSLQNAAKLLGAAGICSATEGAAQFGGMLQDLLDRQSGRDA